MSTFCPAKFCVVALAVSACAGARAQTANVRGTVVDAATGEPLNRVSVSTSAEHRTTTDAAGRFQLAVPAGTGELRVWTVGYGTLKRTITAATNATTDLDLRLSPEALHITDSVTVSAGPFDRVVPGAPAEYTLDQRELADLSSVLANDPFRAVAALPGVAANQDAYADFAVRGAGSAHIGVFTDGVLVEHPTYSLEDNGTIGSLSVINGDVVESVALLSGAFPVDYGNRTAAVLDIKTRDGATDRVAVRGTADFLGAGVTVEGPLHRRSKASWLASGRQSYLGYLLDRLGISNNLTLNYRDANLKVGGDLSPTQRLDGYATVGATTASRNPINAAGQTNTFFTNGAGEHTLAYLSHTWTPTPRAALSSKAFWTRDHEHNTNPGGATVLDTTTNLGGVRSDASFETTRIGHLRGGLELRTTAQDRLSVTQWDYPNRALRSTLRPLDSYDARATLTAGYLSAARAVASDRLLLTAGLRVANYAPTGQTAVLPQASARIRLHTATALTAAFAQYAQAPTLQQRLGAFGQTNLRMERATHWNVSLEQMLGARTRLHAAWYSREDREGIYSAATEFRLLSNNTVGFPTLGPTLSNQLNGTARGFEIELHQRTANRLAGFVGYAYSHAQNVVPSTSLHFDSDADQRHAVTAYATYRITRSINLSANLRYGSGLPIPGFLTSLIPNSTNANTSVTTVLGSSRNTLRANDFFRTDARLSKVWTHDRFSLTLKGETENITARTNYSYYQFVYPSNVAATSLGSGRRETILPFLPAAGILIEF